MRQPYPRMVAYAMAGNCRVLAVSTGVEAVFRPDQTLEFHGVAQSPYKLLHLCDAAAGVIGDGLFLTLGGAPGDLCCRRVRMAVGQGLHRLVGLQRPEARI